MQREIVGGVSMKSELDLRIEQFVAGVVSYREEVRGWFRAKKLGKTKEERRRRKEAKDKLCFARVEFEELCSRFQEESVPKDHLEYVQAVLGGMAESGWPDCKEAIQAQHRLTDVGLAIGRAHRRK